jgi:hypothetical protein
VNLVCSLTAYQLAILRDIRVAHNCQKPKMSQFAELLKPVRDPIVEPGDAVPRVHDQVDPATAVAARPWRLPRQPADDVLEWLDL